MGANSTSTDRVNRIVLGCLGVILTAAGVATLLLANGALQWSETPGSIYRRGTADALGAANLSAAIAMAVCLVLLLVGLRWARAQLRPVSDGARLGTLRLGDGERGRTSVPASAVGRAAGADLASCHGVSAARVRLLAIHPVPRAVVVVEMAIDADPREVMLEVSAALGRLARALAAPTVDADLRLRFGRERRAGKTSRVR